MKRDLTMSLTAIIIAVSLTSPAVFGQATDSAPASADTDKKIVDLQQLKHPLQPALWKIEGQGLQKPSYLFGTVNHDDKRVTRLHPVAEEAFAQATRYYAQLDSNPAMAMMSTMRLIRNDKKGLSKSLGPELTQEVKKAVLDADPDFELNNLQIVKTWVASMLIPGVASGSGESTVGFGAKTQGAVLHARSKSDGKSFAQLETVASETAEFEQFTEAEQIEMVRASVEILKQRTAMKKAGKQEIRKQSHELYLTNDLAKVAASVDSLDTDHLKDKKLAKRVAEAMTLNRNAKMVEKMHGFLSKTPADSHFFAVAVQHNVGQNGIAKLLTDKGYKVTPLFKPLDENLVIKGYRSQMPKSEVIASKKPETAVKVGTKISEIHWGKHLAGPKLANTGTLDGKVVLLVLWGS